MTTLLLLAHCSPELAYRFTAALPGVEARAFVAPPLPGVPGGGLSSRYATLAARLAREPGGLLPALVRYVGAGSVEGWSRIVLASWSAGFKLAEALFAPLASGAPLAPPLVGWVALDSGYSALDPDGTASDRQLAGFVALARLARTGGAMLWFGHTDLPVTAYADTGNVARELVRLAGPPAGLFRIDRWPTDGRPWAEQHSAALLERGPAFVAAALAALDGGAPASTPRTGEVPMLRQGSTGPAVAALQRALNERGGSAPLLDVDGDFGQLTLAAVRAFQRAAGLDADGVAGPLTWAALLAPEGEATPAPPGSPPFPSLSEQEKDALFGPLRWERAPTAAEPGGVRLLDNYAARELVSIVVPQLRGVRGARADGRVTMHRLAAAPMLALFERWEAEGLLPLVLSWAGSVAFRLVRGGSTLSSHARGISFDINADFNGLGRVPLAVGVKGSVRRLVPAARHLGWFWGGDWERPDGMHFELVRV